MVSAASLPAELRPAIAEIKAEEDVLRVVWPDAHESAYSAAWLRLFSEEIPATAPVPSPEVPPPLMRFSARDLEAGDEALRWAWLSAVHQHGAVLVHDAPSETQTVMQVARWMGPVQNQIYGEAWDVVSSDNAINIAYTGEYLGPHMDLCYYESPPGIQLLHCMEFPPEITGGESFLIDAFAVANALRVSDPQAFADLSRIPATFVKDHSDRAEPVRAAAPLQQAWGAASAAAASAASASAASLARDGPDQRPSRRC
jgi:gamma-butyrobetaine dioxygenase